MASFYELTEEEVNWLLDIIESEMLEDTDLRTEETTNMVEDLIRKLKRED